MITMHLNSGTPEHFTVQFEGKLIVTEAKELKGLDKKGKELWKSFEIDSTIAHQCKEIYVGVHKKFGSLIYKAVSK